MIVDRWSLHPLDDCVIIIFNDCSNENPKHGGKTMKKSGFLVLVAMLFLVTTSISAGGIGLLNSAMEFNPSLIVQEAKIDMQEEVVGAIVAGEINAVFSADSIRPSLFYLGLLTDQRMHYMCLIDNAGGFAVRLKYPLEASTI